MGNPVVHFEVMGTDGPALMKFYADLFGWHVQDMSEAMQGVVYGVVDTHAGEGINGGIGQSPDGSIIVTFYVETDDPQALLDKAVSLGGKVALPVSDVGGIVTLAQFLDPQGNRIGIVKTSDQETPGVSKGKNPSISWFEILGTDAKPLHRFYSDLLGWKIDVAPDATIEYGQIEPQGGRGIGGGIGASPTGEPMTTVYAKVDNLEKYLERAEKLGGKTVVQPMDVETITFAQFADPQGNVFGLYKDR
jgi:hypothetical protein